MQKRMRRQLPNLLDDITGKKRVGLLETNAGLATEVGGIDGINADLSDLESDGGQAVSKPSASKNTSQARNRAKTTPMKQHTTMIMEASESNIAARKNSKTLRLWEAELTVWLAEGRRLPLAAQ